MKGGSKRTRYTKEYTEPANQPTTGGGAADPCAAIKFSIQLQKVTSAAATLRQRDTLDLRPKGAELQAFDESEVLCGSVLSPRNEDVIECIGKGNRYTATVTSIKGKTVYVDVKMA
jgi:hypothetical protein